MDQVDDDVINLNQNLLFDYQNVGGSSVQRIQEQEDNLVIDGDSASTNVLFDEENIKEYKSQNDYIERKEVSNEDDQINLGDSIILKPGSKVYDNVYSSIDKKGGYSTYYSSDTSRSVNYIGLIYNNNVIYSSDEDEINMYKSMGAKVVSVCTDDGFYNVNDIVKVKSKKLLKILFHK